MNYCEIFYKNHKKIISYFSKVTIPPLCLEPSDWQSLRIEIRPPLVATPMTVMSSGQDRRPHPFLDPRHLSLKKRGRGVRDNPPFCSEGVQLIAFCCWYFVHGVSRQKLYHLRSKNSNWIHDRNLKDLKTIKRDEKTFS